MVSGFLAMIVPISPSPEIFVPNSSELEIMVSTVAFSVITMSAFALSFNTILSILAPFSILIFAFALLLITIASTEAPLFIVIFVVFVPFNTIFSISPFATIFSTFASGAVSTDVPVFASIVETLALFSICIGACASILFTSVPSAIVTSASASTVEIWKPNIFAAVLAIILRTVFAVSVLITICVPV